MTSKNANDIQSLFDDAQEEGMSQLSTNLMVENLNALTLAGAQGVAANDLYTDEVTLAITVLDESGSMDSEQGDVIGAYNDMLEALKASKNADSILMSTWAFNTKPRLLHGFLPLDSTPVLDRQTYSPGGGTAIFDTVLDAFTSVVAYGQDLRNSGIVTKVDFSVATDGGDNSSNNSVASVKTLAQDLLAQEFYVLTLIAFGGQFAHQVAASMGFPNVWEFGASGSDIRRAMQERSKSIIRTSQTKIGGGSSSFFS